MPLTFSCLLKSEGINPNEVRLLRHQTAPFQGRTPYTLWRDQPDQFEIYQSYQHPDRVGYFRAPYWASFVVTPDRRTLFVGLYNVEFIGVVEPEVIDPLTGLPPGADIGLSTFAQFSLTLSPLLADISGRLVVDWGAGTRSWVQRADRSEKPIVELARAFQEEQFPGFTRFVRSLSDIESMPAGWHQALRSSRGVYLLACPRTREHYVGGAYGQDGFLGRWRTYVASNHGGNIGLRIREPSDWTVSILEVVGSATSDAELQEIESLWKAKLLSRDMGLNRN
jgi:hypothetical protein